MKKLLSLFAAALALVLASACNEENTETANISDEKEAYELATRVIGRSAESFVFVKKPSGDGKDYFDLSSSDGKVTIKANSSNSMAVGLNYYLKYICKVDVSWMGSGTYALPNPLPSVGIPVHMDARVDDRFFLNYCTFGYTFPWWGWKEWERLIDWMALQGVNLPLAITGEEAIWYEIWTEMGLTDEEVRNYFTGPSHLPWHRMMNIDGWGGPLPLSWLNGQKDLQKRIVARERALRMRPVLPAFSGHVPAAITKVHPDAPLTKVSRWAGFSEENSCTFLDPTSDLFAEIQKKYLEKQTAAFGTDHVYGIDIFNEVDPASWEPEYLGRVSKQVYKTVEAVDSTATWLQMGWMFYYDAKHWTDERLRSYVTSAPKDKQIILDYYCDNVEVWRRTQSFYGVPFVWCYLGNFGGNTDLAGNLERVNERIENTFAEAGPGFKGIGSTLEGLDCNPMMYEYLFEKAWTKGVEDTHKNITSWIASYALRRGCTDETAAVSAWTELVDSVYCGHSSTRVGSWLVQRPTLEPKKKRLPNYSNAALEDALGLLLAGGGAGSNYEFDVVNLCRQWLLNVFSFDFEKYKNLYADGEVNELEAIEREMLEIADDVDRLLATQPYFMLGKWIGDARALGVDPTEANYYESNARNLITTWGAPGSSLNDYACRSLSGLISSYYRVRWEMFFSEMHRVLANEGTFDEDAFKEQIVDFEGRWNREMIGRFPSSPVGNSVSIAQELYSKYSHKDQ